MNTFFSLLSILPAIDTRLQQWQRLMTVSLSQFIRRLKESNVLVQLCKQEPL